MIGLRVTLVILLGVFGSFSFPAGASAQEGFLMEVHWLDATDATSTCIGDASTPRCAVDTLLACAVRDQASMCEKVGLDRVPFHLGGGPIEYAVISEIKLREEIVPSYLLDEEEYQIGNVVIQLLQRFCKSGDTACPEREWWLVHYFLKPTRNRYAVISWTDQPRRHD